jgi:biopolymer transport protein ExbD
MASENVSIGDGSGPYKGWPEELLRPQDEGKKRRAKKQDSDKREPPALNSLMDVVTIILVYLIKSFATSPIDVADPATDLPMSTSMEKTEEAAVVLITGPVRKGFVNGQKTQSANTPQIVVDDLPVLSLGPTAKNNSPFAIPEAELERKFVLKKLRTKLKEVKEAQEMTASITEEGGFNGKIVIIADKATPYSLLTQVLITCGEAGFGEYKFAIVRMEG